MAVRFGKGEDRLEKRDDPFKHEGANAHDRQPHVDVVDPAGQPGIVRHDARKRHAGANEKVEEFLVRNMVPVPNRLGKPVHTNHTRHGPNPQKERMVEGVADIA